jgi:hypothetical protein
MHSREGSLISWYLGIKEDGQQEIQPPRLLISLGIKAPWLQGAK